MTTYSELRQLHRREWTSWQQINYKCEHQIKPYEGISVQDDWKITNKNGFRNFIDDVGPKPTPSSVLSRLDKSGDWDVINSYWALSKKQNQETVVTNQKSEEWRKWMLIARENGIEYQCFYARVSIWKWDYVSAATTPSETKYYPKEKLARMEQLNGKTT